MAASSSGGNSSNDLAAPGMMAAVRVHMLSAAHLAREIAAPTPANDNRKGA
jgi:hypothetical protein